MKSSTRKWLGPVLAAVIATALLMALSGPVAARPAGQDPGPAARTEAAATGTDELHTEGGRTVDKQENRVRLTGADRFGRDATGRVLHGRAVRTTP